MERYGSKVSDYRAHNEQIDLTKISPDLKSLIDMVKHIPLSHNKDAIIWGETENGNYTIASGYETMQNNGNAPVLAKAWYLGLIPKINIFFLDYAPKLYINVGQPHQEGEYDAQQMHSM